MGIRTSKAKWAAALFAVVLYGFSGAPLLKADSTPDPPWLFKTQTTPQPRERPTIRQAQKAWLSLLESHYQRGDAFRAESEILRFLAEAPEHPASGAVALLRAKLYYRQGRYAESSLMLLSHLDTQPNQPSSREAAQLLTFSLLRQGRVEEAEGYLGAFRQQGESLPSLAALRRPLGAAVKGERAAQWSTFVPGAGFFVLGEPGRAFTSMGVNLFCIGAAVAAFNADLPLAGLVFLLAEVSLYKGGREVVREEAKARLRKRQQQEREHWLARHGEQKLLQVGLRWDFGGP